MYLHIALIFILLKQYPTMSSHILASIIGTVLIACVVYALNNVPNARKYKNALFVKGDIPFLGNPFHLLRTK